MSIPVYLVIMLIPVFISLMFIPYWTRKTESFGVSIPEEAYQLTELRNMRKQYASVTALLAVLSTAVLLVLSKGRSEDYIGGLFSIVMIVFIVISFGVYLYFHNEMKKLKQQHKEWGQKAQLVMIETGFRGQKLTYSNFWFLIPFALAAATIAITLTNYDKIPDRIPMQYDFSGNVTNWTDKSLSSVLLFPILQVYLTGLFLFINVIIGKAKQQISAANPEQSIRQNVLFRRRWSMFTIIMGAGIVLLFMLTQLSFMYTINQQVLMAVPLVFAVATLVGTIVLSMTTGQGGSRVKVMGSGEKGKVINRDDDRYWKLGIFYFNPNDPAIFLEKRFGIGWTNNWAHPLSWLFVIVILLIAVGLPYLLS